MKSLLKIAMGAALAGALVSLLNKQRGRGNSNHDSADHSGAESTPTVLVADESSVGESGGDDRVRLPDDGRVGQNPPQS